MYFTDTIQEKGRQGMQGGDFRSWMHLGANLKQNATEGTWCFCIPQSYPGSKGLRRRGGGHLRRAVTNCDVTLAYNMVSFPGLRKVRKSDVLFVGKMKILSTWGSYDSCFFCCVPLFFLVTCLIQLKNDFLQQKKIKKICI